MQALLKGLCIPLLAGIAVLSFVACGGGDDKPATSATATQQSSASTNAATQEPEDTETSTEDAAGDDTSGGDSVSGVPDACTLLTLDEITEALGEETTASVTNDNSSSACFWESTTPDSTGQVEVVVNGFALTAEEMFDGADVDGIGDIAHWVDSFGILDVVQGNYDLTFEIRRVTEPTDDELLALTKTMAQKALARMPE
jgi:hypothetical protein